MYMRWRGIWNAGKSTMTDILLSSLREINAVVLLILSNRDLRGNNVERNLKRYLPLPDASHSMEPMRQLPCSAQAPKTILLGK